MKDNQDNPLESQAKSREKQFSVSPLRRALAALVVRAASKKQRDGLCDAWGILDEIQSQGPWTKAQFSGAIDDAVRLGLGQIVLKGNQLYLKVSPDQGMPPNSGSPEESGR